MKIFTLPVDKEHLMNYSDFSDKDEFTNLIWSITVIIITISLFLILYFQCIVKHQNILVNSLDLNMNPNEDVLHNQNVSSGFVTVKNIPLATPVIAGVPSVLPDDLKTDDNSEYDPNTVEFHTATPWNTSGDGTIAYLDRHDVTCPKNGALADFQLGARENNKEIQYKYNCLLNQQFGEQKGYNTLPIKNNNGSTFSLDNHDISCPNGSVLSQFRVLNADDLNTSVAFRCSSSPSFTNCSQKETIATSGNDSILSLATHNVSCPNNKVLSKIKLVRNTDGTFKYVYTCCGQEKK